ncbi:MAG: hypothetical protein AAGA48_00155 [Myxococcota bacterium]
MAYNVVGGEMLVLSWLMGCGGMGEAGPDSRPTFADVGPIFEQRCVGCHQDGGIGPFPLTDYDNAQMWAEASAAATAARTMPPFLVVGDGTCGDWVDSEWLTDEELATIAGWAEAGAPEGDGYDVQVPVPPSLEGPATEVTTPDFLPEIVGGELAEFDEYRCFEIEWPREGRTFLTGYDVIPGNPALVHHVLAYAIPMDDLARDGQRTNREVIDGRKDANREGWPCFSGVGPGVDAGPELVSWAPGQGAVTLPDGSGIGIDADATLVVQVHYNLVDPNVRGQRDQSTVRLQVADAVDREIAVLLPDLFLSGDTAVTQLPPGESAVEVAYDIPISVVTDLPLEFDLLGFFPHMHERGRRMSVAFSHSDGREDTCVGQVDNWDFDWQRIYFYNSPIRFSTADTLTVRCEYDTTGESEPILPGWGTQNEMCLPGVFISLAQ